jgi:ribosomal-protein-alanine N-acetyltransferase
MRLADISQVMGIEQVSFSAPWSARAYRFEVDKNEHSTMLVVRPAPQTHGWLATLCQGFLRKKPRALLGYAGFWLLGDDAHICTIAVHPRWQRRGLGELLLISLLDRAARQGADRATLEVRVSNHAAQQLYRKYGFDIASRRKHYYADNNEDAYIMVTPPFHTPRFQVNLRRHRAQLQLRLRTEAADHPWTAPNTGVG